ncbi:alanine/glycine:cation symporter family protein [Hyphococcus formosus]|uniref:alanine/glycine:cation symporter family protein n=1 Tax=Hyphococcus formosus TaxID=3143534 RepID=UPI00398AA53B
MMDGVENSNNLADTINNTLSPVSDFVASIIFYAVDIGGVSLPLVVVWLMVAGVVMTVSLRFINFRGFRHAVSMVFNPHDQDGADGEISHFQALSAALSGTIGLGNIASVPIAIVIGGPGAVFWMIIAGFFGMATKFAECAMAVKYRKILPDGRSIGGPMYYIEAEFNRRGLKTIGKGVAIFFALMTIGGSISFFQINQSHAQFANVTGISAPLTFATVMSALVAFIALGGIKRIGLMASRLVPFMAILYLGAAIIIIALNISSLPDVIVTIFKSAFGLEAAGGGMVGALINGMRRATYSSEAGVGSAAIAHSAVKTNEPLTEGYVALLEPFIDTVVVCTITALVVILTGAYEPFMYQEGAVGIQITSNAFAGTFAWFPIILLISSTLFAFTSVVSWVFYGAQAVGYLTNGSKQIDIIFKVAICVLLCASAALSVSSILDFIDSMIFAMAIPNILVLYLMLPEIKRDVKAYELKHNI